MNKGLIANIDERGKGTVYDLSHDELLTKNPTTTTNGQGGIKKDCLVGRSPAEILATKLQSCPDRKKSNSFNNILFQLKAPGDEPAQVFADAVGARDKVLQQFVMEERNPIRCYFGFSCNPVLQIKKDENGERSLSTRGIEVFRVLDHDPVVLVNYKRSASSPARPVILFLDSFSPEEKELLLRSGPPTILSPKQFNQKFKE